MGSVKVSVLMAAYNVEHYIDEAIQSVLAQKGVSFELLIGDDASTDRTRSRIQAYRSDHRIRVWWFEVRRGPGSVRNYLINRARGRYLSVCDADDVMFSKNLQRLSNVLDQKRQVGVIYGESLLIDAQGRFLPGQLFFPGPSRNWDLVRNTAPHPGTMLRRDLVRQVGGYRPDLVPVEDHDLFLRLAEITHFEPLCGEITYLWRRHPESLTRSISLRRWLLLRSKALADAIYRRYRYRVTW